MVLLIQGPKPLSELIEIQTPIQIGICTHRSKFTSTSDQHPDLKVTKEAFKRQEGELGERHFHSLTYGALRESGMGLLGCEW